MILSTPSGTTTTSSLFLPSLVRPTSPLSISTSEIGNIPSMTTTTTTTSTTTIASVPPEAPAIIVITASTSPSNMIQQSNPSSLSKSSKSPPATSIQDSPMTPNTSPIPSQQAQPTATISTISNASVSAITSYPTNIAPFNTVTSLNRRNYRVLLTTPATNTSTKSARSPKPGTKPKTTEFTEGEASLADSTLSSERLVQVKASPKAGLALDSESTTLNNLNLDNTNNTNNTNNTTTSGGTGSSSEGGDTAAAPVARWVTREIAALDFLMNIPLAAEQSIVQDGWMKLQRHHLHNNATVVLHKSNKNNYRNYNQHNHDSRIDEDDEDDDNESTQCHDDDEGNRNASYAGVRGAGGPIMLLRPSPKGMWWEKWIKASDIIQMASSPSSGLHHGLSDAQLRRDRTTERGKGNYSDDATELERPTIADTNNAQGVDVATSTALHLATHAYHTNHNNHNNLMYPYADEGSGYTPVRGQRDHGLPNSTKTGVAATNTNPNNTYYFAPGRRLEGDDAIRIQIPLTTDASMSTKQKDIARQAMIREWEIQTAHGILLNTTKQQQQWHSQYGDTTATTTSDDNSNNDTISKKNNNKNDKGKTSANSNYNLPKQNIQQNPPSNPSPPMLLDGRMFFSANSSYPISVFSIIRYEPKREEAAFRRRKLEEIGGGGSQFAMPVRDWRGISYRSLLPRRAFIKHDKKFNRFLRRHKSSNRMDGKHRSDRDQNNDTSSLDRSVASSTSSSSSSSFSDEDDSVGYVPGLLDDPEMVLGRHRNVMTGDHVTGPIVASTIQFVEPVLLKAELNKQFRERFDGWEPPKAARKYIGARVIQGNYVLMDPADDYNASPSSDDPLSLDQQHQQQQSLPQPSRISRRSRQGSIASAESVAESSTTGGGALTAEKIIRMPPSLTLSKIRSVKAQALQAACAANVEISTVALACVYFERLCLHCRVDKSNRRLTFATCLLLAAKLNEPNIGLVTRNNNTNNNSRRNKKSGNSGSGSDDDNTYKQPNRLQALIRPNKRSSTMFASLLEFFTQDWSLSLKHLFDAEWGVFAALGFSLSVNPTHVAFHFKRLMKAMERNPCDYLGREMYRQWLNVLAEEDERRVKREQRNERRLKRKEERILNMHITIEKEVLRRKQSERKQNSINLRNNKQHIDDSSNNKNNNNRNSLNSNSNNNSKGRTSTILQSGNIVESNQDRSTSTSSHTIQNYFAGISLLPSLPSFASSTEAPNCNNSTAALASSSSLPPMSSSVSSSTASVIKRGISDRIAFLQRFGLKRSASSDRLEIGTNGCYDHDASSISTSRRTSIGFMDAFTVSGGPIDFLGTASSSGRRQRSGSGRSGSGGTSILPTIQNNNVKAFFVPSSALEESSSSHLRHSMSLPDISIALSNPGIIALDLSMRRNNNNSNNKNDDWGEKKFIEVNNKDSVNHNQNNPSSIHNNNNNEVSHETENNDIV